MRIPIIAGNWKMNTTVGDAVKLVKEMLPAAASIQGVEQVVCPPFVSLAAVAEVLKGSPIKLGAQNMFFEEKGAYTGEISPLMLKGLCSYVIIGHSERRAYFGETDELINKKVHAAIKAGLYPILCVGETLERREQGKAEEVITGQVTKGLAGVPPMGTLVIAYEPVWAIGTGKAATGEDANKMIGLIRRVAGGVLNSETASHIRIQYGGSVTSSNITEFVAQPEIDGALVGGASLKAAEFASILEQSARIKRGR